MSIVNKLDIIKLTPVSGYINLEIYNFEENSPTITYYFKANSKIIIIDYYDPRRRYSLEKEIKRVI